MNDARAMRIAEIITDYRTLQTQIAGWRVSPPPDPMQQHAYMLLRQCQAEAQALLSRPFSGGQGMGNPQSDDTAAKESLQRVMLDASARRFQAYKIHLRAMAAMRWMQRWNQAAGGQPTIKPAIQRASDQQFRQEFINVTDQRVFSQLRNNDTAKGSWVVEDPTLQRIQISIEAL